MTVRFWSAPVTVEVPATSANLGPGFDSFGLALGLFDTVTAQVRDRGLIVEVDGLAAGIPLDETHLVVRAMRAAFARMCGQPPGLRLRCVNRIPHGSGLGSSAAAIVAGVELARALTPEGSQLSEAAALDLASSMEGHPDNVAACLLGGMTVAWTEDDGAHATKVEPAAVYPVVFSTDIHSATDAARAVLPAQVPHGDAAFNLSRAGLLVLAMTGRPGLLLPATQDRLHQSQRRASMPASFDLMMRLRAAGIPAVISGAGSSVLALTVSDDQAERAVDSTPPGWTGRRMLISGGARLHLVPPSDTLE